MAELIQPDPISRLRWARQHARPHWLRDGRIVRYFEGRQGVPYTPSSATAEYRQLQRRCITNVVRLACESLAAGLRVGGLTPSDLAVAPADSSARDGRLAIPDSAAADQLEQAIAQAEGWRYWQAAGLDAGQTIAALRVTALGYTNVATWVTDELDGDGDDDGDPGVTRLTTPIYEARSVNPLASWGHFDDVYDAHPETFIRRLGGLGGLSNGNGRWEVWSHDDESGYRAVVDERSNAVVKLWRHDLDHVPVTRIVGGRDLEGYPEGRVDPLRPAQDRVNESVFALLMAQTYQSFRQRWAVGIKPGELNPGVDRVWWTESSREGAQWGEFAAADLNNLVIAVNNSLSAFASLAMLPPQNVLGLPSNVSADGLAAAEAGYTRLLGAWQRNVGEGWEEVVRDLGRLAGDDDVATDTASQVRWESVESRSFTAVADGLAKLTAGDRPILPIEVAIELVPGLTQQDRNRALRLLKAQPPTGLAALGAATAGALLPDPLTLMGGNGAPMPTGPVPGGPVGRQ